MSSTKIFVEGLGETSLQRESGDILSAISRLAVKRFPQACRSGGCGICKIQVIDGQIAAIGPQSRAHISIQDEKAGVALACRVTPLSSVRIELIGRLRAFLSVQQPSEILKFAPKSASESRSDHLPHETNGWKDDSSCRFQENGNT